MGLPLDHGDRGALSCPRRLAPRAAPGRRQLDGRCADPRRRRRRLLRARHPSATFILVFKRGSPVAWLFASLSWLLGGVLYPVAVLPDWLRVPAALLPITHAIEGMRPAVLQAAAWSALGPSLLPLALFALGLLPLSLVGFHYAARWARIAGTRAQY